MRPAHPNPPLAVAQDEVRHPADAARELLHLFVDLTEFRGWRRENVFDGFHVEARVFRRGSENLDVARRLRFGKVGLEDLLHERVLFVDALHALGVRRDAVAVQRRAGVSVHVVFDVEGLHDAR